MPFGTIEQAIADIRDGKLVVVADDEDRESEGDVVAAAELITPEKINFMATHGRGLVCLTLTPERTAARPRWPPARTRPSDRRSRP